jgi:aromatic ring hydroxylase
MAIRRGEQLLHSLRDSRLPFIDSDRAKDVTTDPRLAAAAPSLAGLYDMQHDPAPTIMQLPHSHHIVLASPPERVRNCD